MIRSATSNDFDFVYDLYMHPQVNPWLLYEPMDKKSFKPIFDDLLKAGVKYIFQKSGEDVGMVKLVPLTYRASHVVYLGGLAVHPEQGGKGYGFTLLNEVIQRSQERSVKRIELSVATINTTAIKLYEKVGFEKEGILRKYTHLKNENRFLDEVLMSYIL